ncbi:hypothetical protein SYNTR_1196 [Candidatus Syntrophocurvum alkaliphilum]|uniref:CRISPR type III-associated protein domain-containing protein n=1 Tax=Candidatus Syntrophocurvum alkaliphilum TaxID=2293317 RepID=A0A6I6DBZ6_9FIRM|nr:CRISPR-associated RAMP protein Csx7 [Candidatus Syntrophocurvum alkaliphilum]QGT99789.1 hypothetical protein SYNTR_1196 [Candidatus Syntrophocurvum alkaliphilum]
MFKDLKNEAIISFNIKPVSPLAIRSGQENVLEPNRPDMQCVRSFYGGKESVYIPGASLKGVIRTRCEQIINLLGGVTCNVTNSSQSCSNKQKELSDNTAKEKYENMCLACQLFGSTLTASRIAFPDAYPIGEVITGIKKGVGINRITGAAQQGALYDQEVVESAVFNVSIFLTNYELKQLKLSLWAIKDLDDGLYGIGGGTTRGMGRVTVSDIKIKIRDYRSNKEGFLLGREKEDIGGKLDYKKEAYYFTSNLNGWEELLEEGSPLYEVDVSKSLTKVGG